MSTFTPRAQPLKARPYRAKAYVHCYYTKAPRTIATRPSYTMGAGCCCSNDAPSEN